MTAALGVDLVRRCVGREFAERCSPFGGRVAQILDVAWAGLYHLPQHSLRKVDWSSDDWMDLTIKRGHELATYDGSELTLLVVLAHDQAIRLSIRAGGFQGLKLTFHCRHRKGNVFTGHPTLERASAWVREQARARGLFSVDHEEVSA